MFGVEASSGGAKATDADLALSLGANEAQARAKALSEVLQAAAAATPVNDAETLSAPLTAILLDRMADPAVAVANVLLSAAHTGILSRLATQAPMKALAASLSVINDAETPRATILLHIEYLIKNFLAAVPDRRAEVLQKAIWPRLLATKASAKLWRGVWTLLKDNVGAFPVLGGCSELVNVDADKEDLPTVNEQLAARIALNVQAGTHVDFTGFLLASAASSAPVAATSTLLSALVLAKLCASSSSPVLIVRILASSSSTLSAATSATGAPEAPLSAIYSKPTSSKTRSQSLAYLRYTALLSISSPANGAKWCWLASMSGLSDELRAFKDLAYEAYQLAHTSGTPAATATAILTALFTKAVQEDALAFLASVFTSTVQSISLRKVALKDALAFLQANEEAVAAGSGAGSTDLQCLLPSVLVALSAPEKEIRQAAIALLEHISRIARKGTSAAEQRIYGFDTFYGPSADNLQYLQADQVQKVCGALLDGRTELLLDGTGALQLLLSQLDEAGASKKKSLSHPVLCFVASHALAWSDVTVRTALLSAVRDIQDSSKIELYAAILGNSLAEPVEVTQSVAEEYAILTVEAYSTLPKSGLEKDTLDKYRTALQSRSTSRLAAALRAQARERLRLTLFKAVTAPQRLLLLECLVSLLLTPVQVR